MNLSERITVDPEQCGGKPCIRGMRIRVKDILEMLGSGMTDADILAEFPYLEAADLRASQLYAARLTDGPALQPSLHRLTPLPRITMSYKWKKSSLSACPKAAAAA